ncbi:MAG: PAS domain S-box protein [Bacteroidales bacterium]
MKNSDLNNEPAILFKEQLRILGQSLSDLNTIDSADGIFKKAAQILSSYFNNTVVLVLTIDLNNNTVEFKALRGVEKTLFDKISSILNYSPLGKKYTINPDHLNYFRQGKLIEIKNGLSEFVSEAFPSSIINKTQKILNINNVYTIGINKDDELYAAIHFFTLGSTIICDNDFIESFAKQVGILIHRIQLQNELSLSESKYRTLTNQLPVGIYRTTPEGKILFANKSLASMLEYENDEIYKINATELYAEIEERNSEIALISDLTNNYTTKEIKLKTKSGKIIIVNDSVRIICDKNGKALYYDGVLEDITARKETEKALLLNEEKYRYIAENVNDYIWTMDKNFQVTFISPSIKGVLGFTADEIMKRNLDFLETESLKNVKQVLAERRDKVNKGIVDNTQRFFEFKAMHKNGSEVWIEMSTNPVYNEDKEFAGLIGVNRDITERKKAQEKLNESQARFKILTEMTIEGIVIHDSGIIIDTNPSLQKMIGATGDYLKGRSIFEFIKSKSQEITLQRIESKATGTYEATLIRVDKTTFPAELEAKNVIIDNKKLRVIAIRDITERKTTEKEILKLSTAVTQSPASIVITDLKGNIEYVNPQFTKITGYKYNEAIGKNPRILKSGYTSPDEYENLWNTITNGGMWKGEFHNRKKDGTLYWELATISPIIDETGKIIQYIAVKEDITARKEAEDALKQSEKELIHANATKDLFFSIIAHDLKGPIGNFVQFLELITEKANDYSESEKEDIIKTLYDLSIKTNDLLEDLLLWSRIQMNKIDLSPEKNNLFNIANSSIAIVNENAKKKNIEIVNLIDENTVFFANDTAVKTILRNLLSNAIKFSHRQSKVTLKSIPYPIDNKFIEVTISDHGVGISSETIEKLFRIETNVTTYGTEKEKGTGLGLILCRELVEKNGGRVWVESIENEGSTFHFTIPAN